MPEDLTHTELFERVMKDHPKHILINPTRPKASYVRANAGSRVALIDQPAVQLTTLDPHNGVVVFRIEEHPSSFGDCLRVFESTRRNHVNVKRFHAPQVLGAELILV